MTTELAVSIGQHSDRGRKPLNQDFHGVLVPGAPLLRSKGIAAAIADGISSSAVAHEAAAAAVRSFLTDYYATPDSWSVKTSAQRVIAAANAWLHAQTRRLPGVGVEQGYVCTFTVLVLKSARAHIFHVGDARVSRLEGTTLEPLTEEHRVPLAPGQSLLGRALGAQREVDIDYIQRPVAAGNVFVLATDGVHEHLDPRRIAAVIHAHPDALDQAAQLLVAEALENGSADNLTIQILRVDSVPTGDAIEAMDLAADLEPPPLPAPGDELDGWRIIRELHASARSHVYLATDVEAGGLVVLKVPSIDLRTDAVQLRRFAMEEWVARRLDSPHVLRAAGTGRPRRFLYTVMEHVEGQTLAQWMRDTPRPDLERVRDIVGQVAKGLLAFHRKEMLHQDLRPENIMLDAAGTVRIIDFGAVQVAGIAEAAPTPDAPELLGALQYAAPECVLGEAPTMRSDVFSLGVIAYQMLTGQLPYGTGVARARSRRQQRRLRYSPAANLPSWLDRALEAAVSIEPARRPADPAELAHTLRHPRDSAADRPRPLLERNPLLVWQVATGVLTLLVLVLLQQLWQRP